MINDLDKIDSAIYDKWKKTIYMAIYDTDLVNVLEDEVHKHFLSKKVENYVNYILNDGMIDYFSLKKNKKYKYVIQVIMDFALTQDYSAFLDSVNKQVCDYTNNMVSLSF